MDLQEEVYTGFWWGNLRESDHLKDLGVYSRIKLKWVFKKWNTALGLDWFGSGYGQLTGSCEWGNEPSTSIKCG